MIDILVLLLKPSLYFISNPKKYWYLFPVTVIAWIADIFANYLTISVISQDGFPRKGEFTLSQRLGRLSRDESEDRQLYHQIALKINRIDPLHTHIDLMP